uniref:Uncharacterized protein n=1 Tax=Capra hircus TaxID=9925 RepID=A0A8C2XYY8_CAPHI
ARGKRASSFKWRWEAGVPAIPLLGLTPRAWGCPDSATRVSGPGSPQTPKAPGGGFVCPSQWLISATLFSLQCQIRFGGRKEIASDSDSRVTCLCAQFEAVLQHGLKRSRGLALTAAAIKQAAGFASKTETGYLPTPRACHLVGPPEV